MGSARSKAGRPGDQPMSEHERRPRPARAQNQRILAGLSLSLLLVAGAYIAALLMLRPSSPGAELTLDDVIRYAVCQASRVSGTLAIPLLPAGGGSTGAYCQNVNRRISSAKFLDQDSRIEGTLVAVDGGNPTSFWASYPRSDAETADLLNTLSAGQSKVVVDSQSGQALVRFIAQFILPLVLLANLFALLFYFVQRSGSGVAEFVRFGRVRPRRPPAELERRTTFADVAAADEAMEELIEIRDYLRSPGAFAAMGALPPKGMLLVGPPGCGKTLLGRAVAGEAAASFFAMSGSEFVESLVGIGAARVRDLFSQARASAPAIIFIDELDAVGRQRGTGVGQGHDEREQTLNELLVQMDGFSPAEGLVVLAATNRPDILDPALLRAGRFDRHITVERPDRDGRLAILRLHADGRRLQDADRDLPSIARATSGFTGADLANLLNEAALLAVREGSTAITRRHLEEGVERVLGGPRRRGNMLTDQEKRAAAYHEAGHAVVASKLGKGPAIQKLSIIARGRGVGHLSLLQEDHALLRRSDLEERIAISMAGMAVEQMVFGEASTGCEQDVERATHAARDLAGRFGLSERLGPVRVVAPAREVFLGRDYLDTRDVSSPTLEDLDAEVRRIVEEQMARAHAILIEQREALDAVVQALVERETLQGDELAELLGEVGGELRSVSAR